MDWIDSGFITGAADESAGSNRPQKPVWTVTALNTYVSGLLDKDVRLRSIDVSGEISGFKCYNKSGHLYFSVKDESSAVPCVMFRSSAERLRFAPKDGMSVVLHGSPSLYTRDGKFQFYVTSMHEAGEGELFRRFLELKSKLEAEGLFSRKRTLPFMPKCIGIVTSESGAALHDIITVARRRFPLMNFIFAHANVQGKDAPQSLIAALRLLNETKKPDVIIIGRGGGSFEDLNCFNDEGLARAIYSSEIPVVSAVGHEIDYTIADFAADCRAATPSAAAEICVPEFDSLKNMLLRQRETMHKASDDMLTAAKMRIDACLKSRTLTSPLRVTELKRRSVQEKTDLLRRIVSGIVNNAGMRIDSAAQRLSSLNPNGILRRGYAILNDADGKTVDSIKNVRIGQELTVALFGGVLKVAVTGIQPVLNEKHTTENG